MPLQWVAPPSLQPRVNDIIKEFKLKTHEQYHSGKGVLLFRGDVYVLSGYLTSFEGKHSYYDGEVSNASEGFDKYETMLAEMDRLSKKFNDVDIHLDSKAIEEIKESLGKYASANDWITELCNTPADSGTKGMFDTSVRWYMNSFIFLTCKVY